jgi:hypothetical protein
MKIANKFNYILLLTFATQQLARIAMGLAKFSLVLLIGLVASVLTRDFPCPFSRVLSVQDPLLTGPDVRVLQNLLNRSPFVTPTLAITMNYDQDTARAVKQFQVGHKLHGTKGVFEQRTADLVLKYHTDDHYKDDGSMLPGYQYKVYLPVYRNRSIETKGTLFDANMKPLFTFHARAHGQNDASGNALGMFCSSGNTPTGLFEFDLNSPEDDPVSFGPYPVNRVTNGLQGNGFVTTNDVHTVRNGILLHTGEWQGWNPSKPMPNSHGCIHSHPDEIKQIWHILVSMGVQVRNNTDGKLPYPYKPQGLISIEQQD